MNGVGMKSVLIVGRQSIGGEWARALRDAGHIVELCRDMRAFQARLRGGPVDVLIVEITRADRDEAMLMAQARSLWPDCRVLAVSPDRSMRSAANFGMGQWTSDHLIAGPVDGEGIVVGLRDLGRTAQGRQTREADEGDRRQASDIPGDVILRCRQALQARWSVKPA